MPIFISHRQADKQNADMLAKYFTQKGVPFYLDSLEPNLQSDKDITTKILERLNLCTHLMAVVSKNTEGSWWVPFEIGAATEKDHRISSLNWSNVSLPEYLQIWPVLKNQPHLDAYIELYKSDKETLVRQGLSTKAYSARVQTAADFHRLMKTYTGQP